MNSNPVFISENSTASKALSIMNKKKITSLLVTSEKNLNTSKNKKLKRYCSYSFNITIWDKMSYRKKN